MTITEAIAELRKALYDFEKELAVEANPIMVRPNSPAVDNKPIV